MRRFKNVQEWLESKPTKEDIERVMNTIKHGVLRESKKEVNEKTRHSKIMQKIVDAMRVVEFSVCDTSYLSS